MSTQEQARKLIVQERQHVEQVEDKMLTRSVEELQTGVASEIDEQARERMTEGRQQQEAVEEKMLTRMAEKIQSS